MTGVLDQIGTWPGRAAAGLLRRQSNGGVELLECAGSSTRRFPWASVTKVLTAAATWVACEEGTVRFDDPAGPPGATLSDLLCHASGLAPDSDAVLAPPRRQRIYSNRGFEVAAAYVEARSGIPFPDYLHEAVLGPLGMVGVRVEGSPAHGASGTLDDLLRLAGELLDPTLVGPATFARATTVEVPGLAGILPGFGRQDPNDWGLGVEIRDTKSPHWTGRDNSPSTFGHFGRSGSFVWVDPERSLALVSLCEEPFGGWAIRAWPELSDAALSAY